MFMKLEVLGTERVLMKWCGCTLMTTSKIFFPS